jgi:hypothetical protein
LSSKLGKYVGPKLLMIDEVGYLSYDGGSGGARPPSHVPRALSALEGSRRTGAVTKFGG